MCASSLPLPPQPELAQSSFLSAPGTVHLAVLPAMLRQINLSLLLPIQMQMGMQETPGCFIT